MNPRDRWSEAKKPEGSNANQETTRSKDVQGSRRRSARVDVIYNNGSSQLLAWFQIGPVEFSEPAPESGVQHVTIPIPGFLIHLQGEHLEKLKRGIQEERSYRFQAGTDEDGAVIRSITRAEVKK